MTEAVLYDATGPRGRRRILLGSLAGLVLVALVVGVAVARLRANGVLEADRWQVLTQGDLQRLLGEGLVATLRAALAAMVLAMVVGGLLAVGRLSRRRWLAMPAGAWVELFRGLPLLLVILFLFLGLSAAGVTISTFWALVGGLTLYNSAVLAEIFRAGILSLPKGQTEAAYSIGLRRGQTLRLILVPQGVRLMLPALISQLVTLLKDTSLGFVIAYAELLRTGRNAVEFLGGRYSIPVYTAIAVIYIAVNAALSFLARWLDRRTRRQLGQTVQPSAADEAA
jgi:glutamate transport system permease protein